MPLVSSAPPSPWQGAAELRYARRHGQTQVAHAYAKAPLRLQRPYLEGPVCHSVLVHTAGGMVAGDELAVAATLAADSQVLITTAAAGKVYRSEGATACQKVQLRLEANSCLEWLPQEMILFEGARYRQQLRVDLEPGATWAGWDIYRFGRSARGETFGQGELRSHLEIYCHQQPLWIERQQLVGGSPVLSSPHGLAGQPVVATLAVVGQAPTPELMATLRQQPAPAAPAAVGITTLQAGLLCRYRGPSTQAARQWFLGLWQILRPWYLGQAAQRLRVWGL